MATKRLSMPSPRPLHISSDAQPRPSSSSSLTRKHSSSITYFTQNSNPRYEIRPQSSLSRNIPVDSHVGSFCVAEKHRRSTGSIAEPKHTPLTLVDKHVDLLRFIAQKESKCMELRSQLAAHEAELALLKRKWERIVNRGLDRALLNDPPSNAPSVPGAQVLDGIKGVGRLLAAGLGELNPPSALPTAVNNLPQTYPARQSISSVSTSGSASTRFSQSSTKSSAIGDDYLLGSPEEQSGREEQILIVEAEDTDITSPNSAVDITRVVDISSVERPKARRRSRDAISLREERCTEVLGNNQAKAAKPTPTPSIPGLGSLPPGTPSWVMETVGKKWEELQRTETFTKNQKRASILISDMSQSLMNVWSAPTASAVTTSNLLAVSSLSSSQRSPGSPSILDDEEEGWQKGFISAVMTPDPKAPPCVSEKQPTSVLAKTAGPEDDDEWNW